MLLIPLTLLCVSCTTVQTQSEVTQAGLLVKCEPLPEVTGGDGVTVFPWVLNAVAQYNDCATRHNGLVDAVKQAEQ